MKISSLVDFIPEFQKKPSLIVDFDERIFDTSSHHDGNSEVFFVNYKRDWNQILEIIKRIKVEYNEAQEKTLKNYADKSLNSIISLINNCETRLNSELAEVLSHFVSEEIVHRVIGRFSSCLHKLFQDKIVSHTSAFGDKHLIERLILDFEGGVLEKGVIDDESGQVIVKDRNTTVILDLNHFKSYLKEQISLETKIERSR